MAADTLGDSYDDLIAKARCRWSENSIVYKRRNRKKAQRNSTNDYTAPTTTTTENPTSENPAPTQTDVSFVTSATTAEACPDVDANWAAGVCHSVLDSHSSAVVTKEKDDDFLRVTNPEYGPTYAEDGPQAIRESSPFSREKDSRISIAGESGSSPQLPQGINNANGLVKPLVISTLDDRIRFNLNKATAKNDIKELQRTLICELDQVTRLVKQLEDKDKELQITPYKNNTQINNGNLRNSGDYVSANTPNDVIDRRLMVRENSEKGHIGNQETRHVVLSRANSDMGATRNIESRPYSRQFSVSVMENNNNRASEFIEKEKRTPKANQLYKNSEFLLGKDRLPPESNKKLKTSKGRKEQAFGFERNKNQMFKNCSGLLRRLIEHKHGWVFKDPVDAKAMGLVDYHDIIKHPMDLGTIKTRLSGNWYKLPRDFAEDVRLVFHNAMIYNPKGQDVHIMAEELLQIFEKSWAIIETEYNSNRKHQIYPTSRRARQTQIGYVPPDPQIRASDRPEAVDHKIQRPHVVRAPARKKPKSKDPNKRDMTYEEKQKLSTNLQDLPPEKLDAIVQIIKRRSTALSQHDDEIEVDIDSVDTETLWELDRFVTNYRKCLSKYKRKAELALQSRSVSNQNVAPTNSVPAVKNQIGSGAVEKSTDRPAEGERPVFNGSSSSSDSGSSSSDSDSDSSSADGSDAEHSPRS